MDDLALTTRGLATRTRILNCGLRLMWRHGYAEVGINRLIDEAGVLKGSFYHFFPSKLDLLLAMFDHLWQLQRRQIERIYRSKASPGEALSAHIDWICEAQIRAKKVEGFVPGLLHMAAGITLLEDYPAVAEKVRGSAEEHNTFIFEILRQITPHGDDIASRYAKILSHFISGAILNARIYNSLDPIYELQAFSRAVVRFLEAGGQGDPWLTLPERD